MNMNFVTPGICDFTHKTLRLAPMMVLQVSLACFSPTGLTQQVLIESSHGDRTAGNVPADLVDCIFKDSFEACLAWLEGYPDSDADGFGDGSNPPSIFCNTLPNGFVENGLDCNDDEDAIFPGNIESCDGLDNDCDPDSPDGAGDPEVGAPCDGADTDLCEEGTRACAGGALVCSDTTESTYDICDGLDNDCDPASDDGSEDPGLGAPCDGPDGDLCMEGSFSSCIGGALDCNDNTADNLDVCDGVNNDCDPASVDGSEDPEVGLPCDGADTDLCEEGTRACAGGALVCSDNTDNNLEICGDEIDNDCDGLTDEGC